MAFVIAFLSQKGGSGKTTLATNLASALHRNGFKTLLVDSDNQRSARDWRDAKPEGFSGPTVVGIDGPSLHTDLPKLSNSFEYIVIDGAAKLEKMAVSALKASDLVLIPVQPSALDLWASEPLVSLVQARQELTDGKPFTAFVVSRQIQRTELASEIEDAARGMGLPVLSARTTQRVAYPKAIQSGQSVLDIEPEGKAAMEVETLLSEILETAQSLR